MKNSEARGKIFLIFLFLFFSLIFLAEGLFAQDIRATIHKNDKTSIEVVIKKVGIETVEYRLWDRIDEIEFGPLREIPKSDIWKIEYEDGSSDTFDEFQKQQPLKQQPVQTQPSQQPVYQEPPPEEEPKQKAEYRDPSKQGLVLGGRVGFYIPYEASFRNFYDPGLIYGFFLGYWNNKFGMEFDWKNYSKEGTPYTSGPVSSSYLHCSINSFLFTGYYEYYKKGNFVMYAGAGLGLAIFKEELSITSSIGSDSDAIKLNGLDIHSTAGFMFRPVYIEFGFSSISFSDRDLNPGGIMINAGLFF